MMNNELRPYSEIKDSHYEWLGVVPNHWKLAKAKRLFKETSVKNHPKEELLSATQNKGVIPRRLLQSRVVMPMGNFETFKLVNEGNFVISLRSFQGGLEYSKYRGIVSPAYNVMEENAGQNRMYYKYLMKSKMFISELQRNVTGIRQGKNIDVNDFKEIVLPIPSLPEQDQIVKYLDNKLAKINKFIKAKKKLIAALKEQKQAIINQAVTKGMDPNVKMKPSGIEWLGDVPEHWDIVYLRNLLKPTSKKNGDHLPLLSVVREKGVILRSAMTKEENHNFIPDDLSGYKVVRTGQFVMNKMKAWQGSYGVSNHDGIVSPAYYIFDVLFSSKEYFHYAIRSKFYVNFFAQASDGIRIGQWDLSLSKMKEIPFLVPPAEEQKKIISYIPTAFMKIDESISKLNREIDLMTEYKARVVSDVVTGKVDVRNSVIDKLEGIDLSDHDLEEESTDEETLDFEEGDE